MLLRGAAMCSAHASRLAATIALLFLVKAQAHPSESVEGDFTEACAFILPMACFAKQAALEADKQDFFACHSGAGGQQ
jgi:hypothetical protein